MPNLSGIAAQWLEKEYGGRYALTKGVFVVGTTSAEALRNDSERVVLILVNTSVNTITINFGINATLINGIVLAANGGSFTANLRDDFILPGFQINAIASAAGSSMFFATISRIGLFKGNPDDA